MIKQNRIKKNIFPAAFLVAFISIHIASGIFVFNKQKAKNASSAELSANSPLGKKTNTNYPRTDPEESLESVCDSFSEIISEEGPPAYPLTSFLKTRTNCLADLYFPDHLELRSPPPEA
jgi:hypothetical protein